MVTPAPMSVPKGQLPGVPAPKNPFQTPLKDTRGNVIQPTNPNQSRPSRVGGGGGHAGDNQAGMLPKETVMSIPENKPAPTTVQLLNQSIIPQNQQINPNTNRPYGVVSSYRPNKVYSDYVKQQGPVSGTLTYLGDRGEALVSKYQRKTGDYYQQEAFREIPRAGVTVATQASYFVPYLGTTLMIAEGTEKTIKEPTVQGKALGVVEAGLGLWGSKATLSKVEERLGYPTYQTRFISKEVVKPSEDQLFFKSVAQTEERNLFGSKQYKSASITQVRTQEVPNSNVQQFVSGTKGFTQRVNQGISKSIPFGEASQGVSKPSTFDYLLAREKNIEVRKTFEGSDMASVSRAYMGNKPSQTFANYGKSAILNNENILFSGISTPTKQTATGIKLLEKRFSTSTGLINREAQPIEKGFMSMGGTSQVTKSLTPLELAQVQSKQAIQNALKIQRTAQQSKNIMFGFVSGLGSQVGAVVNQLPKVQARPGITGSAVSLYAGTGQYERTSGTISPILKNEPKQISSTAQTQVSRDQQKQPTIQAIVPLLRTRSGTAQPQGIKQNVDTTQRQGVSLSLDQPQAQKQRQKQGQQYNFRQGLETTPRGPIGSFFPMASSSVKNSLASGLSKLKKSFNVFTRRGGKEIMIGKNLPEGKATKRGVDVLSRTLARSYVLKEAGFTTEKDISFTPSAKIFARSKRDPNRIVQNKIFSLSDLGERREIQMFKKLKGRKKLKLFG